MEKKEEEWFGDRHTHKLPDNIRFDPADIGEYGRIIKPQKQKTYAQKMADKKKLEQAASKQMNVYAVSKGYKRTPGKTVGWFGNKKPHLKELNMGGITYKLVGEAQSKEKANKLYIRLFPEPETQSKLYVAIFPFHAGKSVDPAYSDKNGNRWVIYVAKRGN